MPEGDTIHRAAARLREVLEGRRLTTFEAARTRPPHPRPGEVIHQVRAKGKHLLMAFSGGLVLQTHMGMTGSWHVYRVGERWQRPAHLARCRIEVDSGWEAVCFSAPTVRLVRPRVRGEVAEAATHLGPDLCLPDPPLEEVLERMRVLPSPDTTIDEVLLDQRVAAGIGNVYKSEVLWRGRVHPFTPLTGVDEDTRRRLVADAAALLRANLATSARTTISGPPGSVAVYGRTRSPCPRCGAPIRTARRGRLNRSTYWCPTCQPANPT